MDNRYYDNVINEMQPFFDSQNFKLKGDCFLNEKLAVKINYNEEKQMYILSVANIEEGERETQEFREINSWLFDDSQNAKDAVAVGIDFTASLRKELGLKTVRKTNGLDINLPAASKSGNMTVSGFAKKMLDVYPPLRDAYKEYIATYGNFLYINFFGEYLIPLLKATLSSGNKKQIKKLYDVLGNAYLKGDKETVNILVAVLCAAAYNDEAVTKAVRETLNDDKHFLSSFDNFVPVFAKNKKLLAALIK